MEFREARNGDPAVPLKTNLICHVPPPLTRTLEVCAACAVFWHRGFQEVIENRSGQVRCGVMLSKL